MNFGDTLREHRARHRMTREQLSIKFGIAVSSIRNYETNRSGPSLATAQLLAKYFGFSLDKLQEN